MSEKITVTGMVLISGPIGESDRRVVLLTQELGKISAFARGARRPGSTLMASTNPFVSGRFTLIAGRSTYNLIQTDVQNYFTELAAQMPGIYYGYYFLDFADYYGREGVDATDMLNLLYLSVRALLKGALDDRLVRRIFELRLVAINGEYAPGAARVSPAAAQVMQYIVTAPLQKLYTFTVSEEILSELSTAAEACLRRVVDRPLRARRILEEML